MISKKIKPLCKTKNQKTVYLPIETKTRELESKLILAFELVKQGFNVYIGHKSPVEDLAKAKRGGYYFDKSGAESKSLLFSILKANGHRIIVFDEEGLVIQDSKTYKNMRLSKNSSAFIDLFIAWGKTHEKILLDYFGENSNMKIQNLGHPRIDLTKPKYRKYSELSSDNIVKSDILISTKFALNNGHKTMFEIIQREISDNIIKTIEDLTSRIDYYHERNKSFKLFLDMIEIIAKKFINQKIILRPHPAENKDFYIEKFLNYKNISVENEENIIFQLPKIKLLIHNNCTTGVEAALFGTPAIQYICGETLFDITKLASINIDDINQLIKVIDEELHSVKEADRPINVELREFVDINQENIATIDIVNELRNIGSSLHRQKWKSILYYKMVFLYKNLRNLYYDNSKFPNTDIKEMQLKLHLLKQSTLEEGDFKIEQHGKNLFYLYQKISE